jgi:hypothetical protein
LDKPHPYFEDHKIGLEHLIKENPADVEMQMLCHQVFMQSDAGQKLYILLLERFIVPGLYTPDHPNAQNLSLYFEGFKEAFRGLINMAKIHQRRIENA